MVSEEKVLTPNHISLSHLFYFLVAKLYVCRASTITKWKLLKDNNKNIFVLFRSILCIVMFLDYFENTLFSTVMLLIQNAKMWNVMAYVCALLRKSIISAIFIL